MVNNHDSNNNNQFVISYELLCLLRWLTEHESERLKKIVTRAITTGLKEEFAHMERFMTMQQQGQHQENEHNIEEIQYSIVEFFGLLEALLVESLNEHAVQKAVEKNLMPAIDHIDATVCDDTIVKTSIEKAANKSEFKSQEAAQEILFKELLKRWKPAKNSLN